MAKKKTEKLTLRQQESQRIMREKSARKKRDALMHRVRVGALYAAAVFAAGGGIWMWHASMFSRTAQAVSDGIYAMTARAGFSVDTLYLEGRNRTPMGEINKVIGVSKGDPILRLPLNELRQQLESVGSIRMAAVERELPDRLVIRIVEREPAALWQHQGRLVVVDDKGVPMPDIALENHRALPLIVGNGASQHVGEVLELLAKDADMARRFTAAVRISERRWNIHLKDGTQVKLPEKDPAKAWETLVNLNKKQQLLDRDVKIIDLRVAGRMFIKVPPENIPVAISAKET